MPTLKEIKKERGVTNADIGYALEVSASVAGMVLQGRYIHTYTDAQIQALADVLGITFERCWYAMQESYTAFMKSPAPAYRADQLKQHVQERMQAQFPIIEIESARSLATVESFIVKPALQIESKHTMSTEEETQAFSKGHEDGSTLLREYTLINFIHFIGFLPEKVSQANIAEHLIEHYRKGFVSVWNEGK